VARAFDGQVLLRIEDHDRGRCRPEFERGILDDLAWLGLEPDEGSLASFAAPGPHPHRQSDHPERYEAALAALDARGFVYPCLCSRRDIAARVGHVPDVETPYDGHCRDAHHAPGETQARRVRLDPGDETFDDLRLGPQVQAPSRQCGDALARDRHGAWTYQFAVTVDDLVEQIDLVVRGEDLLDSTGRQLALARLLGRDAPPRYLHHPLVRHPDGSKLSKSNRDTGLADLRADGMTPAQVLGLAAHLGGLRDAVAPLAAGDLSALWASRDP
jgi:glutamyl/glutaminyl-tRNA synthetase